MSELKHPVLRLLELLAATPQVQQDLKTKGIPATRSALLKESGVNTVEELLTSREGAIRLRALLERYDLITCYVMETI